MRCPLRGEGRMVAAIFALWVAIIVVAWAMVALTVTRARGDDHRHGAEVIGGMTGKFYETWMRPDMPTVSCCNLMDCYATQARTTRSGKVQAIHRESGEWIDIPAEKVEVNRASPDGFSHLCASSAKYVFCFIFGGGT